MLLCLLLVFSTAWGLPLDVSYQSAAPCSGLYSTQGFLGCTSTKTPLPAALYQFPNKTALLLSPSNMNPPISAIVSLSVWCVLNSSELEFLDQHVTSLFVVHNNSETDEQPTPSCKRKIPARLGYPVNFLSPADSLELLLRQKDSSALVSFYMGKHKEMNSLDCLEMQKCDPLGGLSVWSPLGRSELLPEAKLLLLVVKMDAQSFFHDKSFGFTQSGGDIAVALAVAQQLHVIASANTSPVRVIVGFFQGETFARIGSKRFVKDLVQYSAGCTLFSSLKNETCLQPPNYQLEWTKLNMSRIIGVVSLSNVLGKPHLRLSVSHNHENKSLVMQSRFEFELNRVTVSSSRAPSVSEPSSLLSFMEEPSWTEGGGLSISSSELDDDYFGMDMLSPDELDSHVDRAQRVATALLRLFEFLVFNHTTGSMTDASFLREQIRCWGGSHLPNNCSLALHVLNHTTDEFEDVLRESSFSASRRTNDNDPLLAFTGVYKPSHVVRKSIKLRELLLRNMLVHVLYPRNDSLPGSVCKHDVDCRDSAHEDDAISICTSAARSNASRICASGVCVCSPVSWHDAYSHQLELNAREGRYVFFNDSSSLLWTEPRWDPLVLTTFAVQTPDSVWVSWVVGLLFTGGAIVLIQCAQRSSKYKLS